MLWDFWNIQEKNIQDLDTFFFKATRSWKLFGNILYLLGSDTNIPPLNPASLCLGRTIRVPNPSKNVKPPGDFFGRDLCQDVLNLRQWGAWIQDHTCHTSHRFDLVQGAMQMDGRRGLRVCEVKVSRWVFLGSAHWAVENSIDNYSENFTIGI